MATKNFIESFERDNKTESFMEFSHLLNFVRYLIRNSELFGILDICRYAWYVTSGVKQYYLLTQQLLICARCWTYGKCFKFNKDWKGFKQLLIVGRYLERALNGLYLLWRHQNIAKQTVCNPGLIFNLIKPH